VDVYPRSDCCQRFLGRFEVWVGDVAWTGSATSGARLCGGLTAPPTMGPHIVACSTPLSGAVVTVVLPGVGRAVVLAEVAVFGFKRGGASG